MILEGLWTNLIASYIILSLYHPITFIITLVNIGNISDNKQVDQLDPGWHRVQFLEFYIISRLL